MMKNQLFLAVIAVLAVYVSGTAIGINSEPVLFVERGAEEYAADEEVQPVTVTDYVYMVEPGTDEPKLVAEEVYVETPLQGVSPRATLGELLLDEATEGATSIAARSTLRVRVNISRDAIENTVRFGEYTFRVPASESISRIRVTTTGTAPASIRITAGGLNRNHVTIRITSRRGRGFAVSIEIWY